MTDNEINILVAKKIFGCKLRHYEKGRDGLADWEGLICTCEGENHGEPPFDFSEPGFLKNYSTDIAAAWEVVRQLQRLIVIEQQYTGYYVQIWPGWNKDGEPIVALDSSSARAICLAALKVMSVEETADVLGGGRQ